MSIRNMILTLTLGCFAVGCVDEGTALVDEGAATVATVEEVAPEDSASMQNSELAPSNFDCKKFPHHGRTICSGVTLVFKVTVIIEKVLNNAELKLLIIALNNVANNNDVEIDVDILEDAFKTVIVNILNIDIEDIDVRFKCLICV